MIEMSLVDAVAPALMAKGFLKEQDGYFEKDSDSVEIVPTNEQWWLIIRREEEVVSESIVDSITRTLRLLWAYDLIDWDWAEEVIQAA